ncbi:MAG: protein-L-isoaspartate(D-aspartate) O-methyltransferase [Candidatus Brocadiia bacterium]
MTPERRPDGPLPPSPGRDTGEERRWMVERQLRARGIREGRLLEAFLAVPRHRFVPAGRIEEAYEDHPVLIGFGQTISQPYMVAWMTEALELRGGERVLEVGTGSGYQTAILAKLAGEVYSVERIAELSEQAARVLRELGCENVHLRVGDGTLGWPAEGPFDRILVTAGAPAIPQPLKDQLAPGGCLVMPVGGRGGQTLTRLERRGERFRSKALGGCVFVKLVGREGWPER